MLFYNNKNHLWLLWHCSCNNINVYEKLARQKYDISVSQINSTFILWWTCPLCFLSVHVLKLWKSLVLSCVVLWLRRTNPYLLLHRSIISAPHQAKIVTIADALIWSHSSCMLMSTLDHKRKALKSEFYKEDVNIGMWTAWGGHEAPLRHWFLGNFLWYLRRL